MRLTYICDIGVTFGLAYNLTKVVDLIGIHSRILKKQFYIFSMLLNLQWLRLGELNNFDKLASIFL